PGGGGTFSIYGPLTNQGTINWQSGSLRIYNNNNPNSYNGGIVNQAGATFNALCDQSASCACYGYEYFINAGTFLKQQSSNTTIIGVSFTNSSTGSVVAQSGTISLYGGGSLAGSVQAATNATVNLVSGNFDLTGMSAQGAVNLAGAYPSGTLGTAINLISSTINNGTGFTVDTNGVLNINPGGANSIYLYGPLTNRGTVNWQSGTLRIFNSNNPNSANGGIANQAGASFNVQCDQSVACGCDGYEYFFNAGSITKQAGTGVTSVGVSFTNSAGGSVAAQEGTILFNSGGSLAGTFQAATNALIDFNSGIFSSGGAVVFQGPGQIEDGGASFASSIPFSGTFTIGSSGLTGSAGFTVPSGGVLNINGGNGNSVFLYCPLTNYGTVNWQSGNIYAVYCSAAGPIINEPGAVWNALSDQSLAGYNQGWPNTIIYFVNNGIFEKLAGTNVTSASIAFTNTGSVLAQSGTIQ